MKIQSQARFQKAHPREVESDRKIAQRTLSKTEARQCHQPIARHPNKVDLRSVDGGKSALPSGMRFTTSAKSRASACMETAKAFLLRLEPGLDRFIAHHS